MPDARESAGNAAQRRFTVADLPDEERLKALDKIETLLRRAEMDARLLDGRDFKPRRWSEAYQLLDLLRGHAHACAASTYLESHDV
jgi:hypothetical protein